MGPSGFEGVKRPEAHHERPEPMRVWLLGGFGVSVGSRAIGGDAWRLRKAAAVVKLLALAPDHRLHRDQVMDLLWPDLETKTASNNLRQALHNARRTLASDPGEGARYLASEEESLVLCPETLLWVDVGAFEQSAATARYARNPSAYEAALDLYAGELLPEDRYEGWAEGRREELSRLYLALLVEAAELYEERNKQELAIEVLRKATTKEPTLEEAHERLMRLYALSGTPAQALSQYERLHDALSRRLSTEPGAATRALCDEIAAGRFALSQRTAPAPEEPPGGTGKHNLPAPKTTFVGREREMVEVKRTLAMTSLLTLTGAGGCGKTRLAIEVARDLVATYPDGVWLVELAPLSEEALVTQAVAATLGVREQPGRPLLESLLNTLRDKEMLLILDNCERLIDATKHLADALLGSCSRLRVLATSREPLGARGELVWLVPSLSVPGSQQAPTVEELEGYESARLFADRVFLRHPGFELTSDNARAVAQVCAELEGIPLAIELAAARIGLLSAEQISERLGHSLRLLTGGDRTADHRHQTLRGALDWSYDLLSEPEQVLFRRLSVFAGGFTLEAAESVGAGEAIDEDDVLELLPLLVEKSLVVAEESWQNGARYRLLEPIRQYAQEKLEEGEGQEETRYRHAEWYLALAEEADKESSGPGHARWLDRLETEHDNLRAALDWSLEDGDTELSLRLAGLLWWFWYSHGHLSEGRQWLETTIARSGTPRTSHASRAKALKGAGWLALFQNDHEAAKALLEESLTLYRELGDEEGIASSLTYLGFVAVLGEREDVPVLALLEEAVGLKPKLEDRRTVGDLLVFEGLIAASRGDLERGAVLHEESLVLFRDMRDSHGMVMCLCNLGLIALAQTNYERASTALREGLSLARELDHKVIIQYSYYGLAAVATARRRPDRAARLWGAAEAMNEAYGMHLTPVTRSRTNYDGYLAAARSQLDNVAFEEAWAEGKAMTPEEAVEYALAEEKSALPTLSELEESPPSEPMSMLTRREQEVAILVAKHLGNRQIATELMLSEHTVATHVRHILKKLGLHSRIQIAAYFTERH